MLELDGPESGQPLAETAAFPLGSSMFEQFVVIENTHKYAQKYIYVYIRRI